MTLGYIRYRVWFGSQRLNEADHTDGRKLGLVLQIGDNHNSGKVLLSPRGS